MSDSLALSDKMFVHNQVRQDRGGNMQEMKNSQTNKGGSQDYQTMKKVSSFISKYYKEPTEEI